MPPTVYQYLGLDLYRVGETRSTCFIKEDCRKLQVLQNQVSRLLIHRRPTQDQIYQNLPTSELLKKSGDLSVHQLGAMQTVMMIKKTILSKKPNHIAERIQSSHDRGTRAGLTLNQEPTTLVRRREGFIYRGGSLYNLLPLELKQGMNIKKFKQGVKTWVKSNIAVKP